MNTELKYKCELFALEEVIMDNFQIIKKRKANKIMKTFQSQIQNEFDKNPAFDAIAGIAIIDKNTIMVKFTLDNPMYFDVITIKKRRLI